MPRVTEVHSDEEYPPLVQAAGDKLVVVDFSAAWCGPCQRVWPLYQALSDKYPDVVFIKVDVDACQVVAGSYGVRAMPTFMLLRNGTKLDMFPGADMARLETLIQQHSSSASGSSSAPASGSASASGAAASAEPETVPGQKNLLEFLDKKQLECLNQSRTHTLLSCITQSGHLESDCDAQLILSLSFLQPVKLHSIRLSSNNLAQAPKTIKIFANRISTPDFDEAEGLEALQTLTLTKEDLEGEGRPIALKYVKLQNVSSLTLFVCENQGEEDVTQISSLSLFGSPRDATNMAEFKRVAGKAGESDH